MSTVVEDITITIPKGGRPSAYKPEYADTLRSERTTMSINEMATFHGVSRATMCRWLKKAGCVNERARQESESE